MDEIFGDDRDKKITDPFINFYREHEKNTWLDLWENKFDEVMVWKPHNWVEGREYRDATVKRRSCGRPEEGNLTVGVDGRVSICCFDYNKTVDLLLF